MTSSGQALDGGSANQSGGEIRIVSTSFLVEPRVADYDCGCAGTGRGDPPVSDALSAWLSTVSYDPQ